MKLTCCCSRIAAWVALLAALTPSSVWACATCFGKSDAPLAKGMNMGILSLLAVVVVVWASVIAFFVYLARRSAAVSRSASATQFGGAMPESTHKV